MRLELVTLDINGYYRPTLRAPNPPYAVTQPFFYGCSLVSVRTLAWQPKIICPPSPVFPARTRAISSSVAYSRTQSGTPIAPRVTELLKPVGTFRQKTPQPLVAVEAFRRQLLVFKSVLPDQNAAANCPGRTGNGDKIPPPDERLARGPGHAQHLVSRGRQPRHVRTCVEINQ